jgi:diaminopimelate epimerase
MTVRFHKMAGCGNDFVIVEGACLPPGVALEDLGRAVCRHGTGVGADGLVVLDRQGDGEARYRAHIINRSGAPAEMCGNAARCIARFAVDRGMAPARHVFATAAGAIAAEVEAGSVRVTLPPPTPLRRDVPVAAEGAVHVVDTIDIGVPHAVFWREEIETAPVATLGRAIRHAPAFPRGANVNFVAVQGGRLRMRTFERGVEAETLACGTGAAAAAISAAARGHLQPPIDIVTTEGGVLRVEFRLESDLADDPHLSGPATYVFEGDLSDEWLAANVAADQAARASRRSRS